MSAALASRKCFETWDLEYSPETGTKKEKIWSKYLLTDELTPLRTSDTFSATDGSFDLTVGISGSVITQWRRKIGDMWVL